jgi:hypothetical protein
MMNAGWERYREGIAIAGFGLLGLFFFLLIGEVTSRSHLRDGGVPYIDSRLGLCVASDGQVFTCPLVGRTRLHCDICSSDVSEGRGSEIRNSSNNTTERKVK